MQEINRKNVESENAEYLNAENGENLKHGQILFSGIPNMATICLHVPNRWRPNRSFSRLESCSSVGFPWLPVDSAENGENLNVWKCPKSQCLEMPKVSIPKLLEISMPKWLKI